MNQMQAFIEKAKNDKALMAKLNELGASGTEPDKIPGKIIALAAEHGFSITVEEYQLARESVGASKSGELAEEDLDAVAGGGTENRYDPEVCNPNTNYNRTHYNCVGFMGWTWCDHYSRTFVRGGHYVGGVHRHKCAMGMFDYEADAAGDRYGDK